MGQDLKHMPLNPWRLKESGVDDHGEEALLAGPFGMVGGLLYPKLSDQNLCQPGGGKRLVGG